MTLLAFLFLSLIIIGSIYVSIIKPKKEKEKREKELREQAERQQAQIDEMRRMNENMEKARAEKAGKENDTSGIIWIAIGIVAAFFLIKYLEL